jgi:dihydroorotate dehydrogenase
VPILYPLARSILFSLPPETAHDLVLGSLAHVPAAARRYLMRQTGPPDPRLQVDLWDLTFPNPVGLAAGFDKSGRAFNTLGALGFGFVEIGTVTAQGQPGNPRPRLFRLTADRALLNRMGFNNPGAEHLALRLRDSPAETVLGVNIGKSKATPVADAVSDYVRSIELLAPFAGYLVVNVSSPNTPGLRDLQDAGPLRSLLAAVIQAVRSASGERAPPVLVKLAPDLSDSQMDQAVDIAIEEGVSGIVAVNTTLSRDGLRTPRHEVEALGAGGISGAPLRERAQKVVSRIFARSQGRVPIVGVGGIFDASDAWARICAGASLVQIYTGFIYQGPSVADRINRGLLERLETHGIASIADAVGIGASKG